MQPLAVDLRVLRTLLSPDIKVVPGRALMARVAAADGNGRGSLSIAGFIVEAELPKDVRAGQDLRLVVRDVSAERVLLGVSRDQPGGEGATAARQAQASTPDQPQTVAPGAPVPLPGGGTVAVTEREARPRPGGGEPSQSLALRYEAPDLGPMDLRFQLDPGTLQVGVVVSAAALGLAQAEVDGLRRALSDGLGRPVTVTISPRREPVNLYA